MRDPFNRKSELVTAAAVPNVVSWGTYSPCLGTYSFLYTNLQGPPDRVCFTWQQDTFTTCLKAAAPPLCTLLWSAEKLAIFTLHIATLAHALMAVWAGLDRQEVAEL